MLNTEQLPSRNDDFSPAIRRARINQLTIFEISDSELEVLERGSPDSIYLNFAIALLSIAISISVTLATTNIPSPKLFSVFWVIVFIGFIGGAILFLLWHRSHKSVKKLIDTIRKRLPPEGIATQLENAKPQGGGA